LGIKLATIGEFLAAHEMVRIRLIRELAGRLDGIDVSTQQVGDIIELPDKAGAMLIAEGWAEAVAEPPTAPSTPAIRHLRRPSRF
jgi:hypothetical protein